MSTTDELFPDYIDRKDVSLSQFVDLPIYPTIEQILEAIYLINNEMFHRAISRNLDQTEVILALGMISGLIIKAQARYDTIEE